MGLLVQTERPQCESASRHRALLVRGFCVPVATRRGFDRLKLRRSPAPAVALLWRRGSVGACAGSRWRWLRRAGRLWLSERAEPPRRSLGNGCSPASVDAS